MLTASMVLVNQGARGGVIDDLIVETATDKGSDYWTPMFYIDATKYAEGLSKGWSSAQMSESAFYPIFLSGREQVFKLIAFAPRRPDLRLVPNTYQIHFHARVPTGWGGMRWVKCSVGMFVIEQTRVTEWEQGTLVEITSEETRRQRRQIMR